MDIIFWPSPLVEITFLEQKESEWRYHLAEYAKLKDVQESSQTFRTTVQASLFLQLAEYDEAEKNLLESLRLARSDTAVMKFQEAMALYGLAEVCRLTNRPDLARKHLRIALSQFDYSQCIWGLVRCHLTTKWMQDRTNVKRLRAACGYDLQLLEGFNSGKLDSGQTAFRNLL
jgi:tetratricopeptide (TPR) repeat protein